MSYPGSGLYPSSSFVAGESTWLYYVGIAGEMVALPDVYSQIDVPVTRIGATAQSLNGNQWRDTLALKRSWTWKWSNLQPRQLPYVEALAYGTTPAGLRLIDPRRSNRLPEQVASGGSVLRDSTGFAVTAGGVRYRDLRTATATDMTTLPMSPLLRGCQEWVRSSAGAGTLYPSGTEADGTWRLPLTPRDEPLQLFCWVAGSAGVTVGIEWTEYDASGVGTGYFSDAGGDLVTLSATVWQLLAVNIQPASTAVSVAPRLTVDDAQPAGNVLTTAWQIAALDAESLPEGSFSGACGFDELTDGWRLGGGAPYVIADAAATQYNQPGFTDTGLVLTET